MAPDLVRLRKLLDTPQTARMLARMRARLESTGELVGSIVVVDATTEERTAAARIFGKPVRAGRSATVSLDELDAVLRGAGIWPAGLADAVVALTGEVTLPASRIAEREAWQGANDALRGVIAAHPSLESWVEGIGRSGTLRRASPNPVRAVALAGRLVSVADALPSVGESLGVFASRVGGDAHALDAGTALGSLAVGMAGALGGIAETDGRSARWRREAWQAVGIIVDELSSTVLALGLPGGDGSPTARALSAYAAAGQPALLTLRQLTHDSVGAAPPQVYVCENPVIVAAAADRWGADCAPIVCVNGHPGAAVVLLLQRLVANGSRLHYHGDFDWGGLGVARTLTRGVPWTPWRFDAIAYAASASTAHPALVGAAGESPWDPALAPVMAATGRKVEEETVLDLLLGDLGPAVPGHPGDF